jgi:long-chain acyl-CoA synthetase
MFGIYSQSCVEFVLCEIAAIMYGFTTVPVYDTLGEDAMVYIFN